MSTHAVSEDVRERAARWHDRVHRDQPTEETRRELDEWLAESPSHGAAYHDIEATWQQLRGLANDPQILELRHEAALRLTRSASRNYRPLKGVAAAAVLLGLGLALVSSLRLSDERPLFTGLLAALRGQWGGHYSTATGERLTVNLEDGSQITLDTQSALTVDYTRKARRVQLTRGQALFEVAKDRTRPFMVDANHRRLVALGTAFDVRLDRAQVKVTMVEGSVRVERVPPLESEARARTSEVSSTVAQARSDSVITTLTAGEQLIADGRNQDSVLPADADRTTSWRHGQIIFDNTRLADAVAELNRYSRVKLQLADVSLADLKLSGAFATARPQMFVEALTSYFPIEAMQADESRVLLKARP